MKILKRDLKEGCITVEIETLDDLWHLYNIILSGDRVSSRTIRRVRVGDEDSRKQESVRRPMNLVLRVDDVAFHSFSNRVRVKGSILAGPEDLVSIGSFHTFNIEIGTILTICKSHWSDYLLKRLEEAEKSQARPVTLLITIDDSASEVFLIADYGIHEAVTIRAGVSRKRGDPREYDSTMTEFFSDVLTAVRAQLEQRAIGLIVIAGPGFVRERFKEYLNSAGIKNLPQVVVEGTSTIGVPAAKEILYRGVISSAISELKIEKETQLVEELIAHLAKGDGLSTYGEREVEAAAEYGAIAHLLITDVRLRQSEESQRQRLDDLIHKTEQTRGAVHIVSVEHPAGDQLQSLGGIAALLRFRIEHTG